MIDLLSSPPKKAQERKGTEKKKSILSRRERSALQSSSQFYYTVDGHPMTKSRSILNIYLLFFFVQNASVFGECHKIVAKIAFTTHCSATSCLTWVGTAAHQMSTSIALHHYGILWMKIHHYIQLSTALLKLRPM